MITRTCRGQFEAIVFLNRKELRALRSLLDAYIATDETDSYLPQLKKIYEGIKSK